MIKKIEVRRRIALLEKKIKEEKHNIAVEMQKMKDSCTTIEMQEILRASQAYTKLHTRLETLNEVLIDIIDMRCEEIFEDN